MAKMQLKPQPAEKGKDALNELGWRIIFALTVFFRAITLRSLFARLRQEKEQSVLTGIDSGKADLLTAAGIKFAIVGGPLTAGRGGAISVSRKDRAKALEALGLAELYTRPGPHGEEVVTMGATDYRADDARLTIVGLASPGIQDRLSALDPRKLTAQHPIVLARTQEAMARVVVAALRPLYTCPITVHVDGPQNKKGENLPSSDLHVFISTARFDTPAKLCGIDVNSRSRAAYIHNLRGVGVTDPANNAIVGELYGNYLYIFAGLETAKLDTDRLRIFNEICGLMTVQLNTDSMVAQAVRDALLVEEGLGVAAAEGLNPSVDAGDCQVKVVGLAERQGKVVAAMVKALLGPVLPTADNTVEIIFGDKEPRPAVADGKFRIFFDAFRLGGKTVKAPAAFWGWPSPVGEVVYEPSGEGRLIFDESGFPLAELNGDNLYIFLNLVKYGSRMEAMLLGRFLTEVRLLLKAQRLNTLAAQDLAMLEGQARYLTQSVNPGTSESINAAIAKAADPYAKEVLRARRVQRVYYQLYHSPTLELGAEFDQMLNVRKVLNVTVSDSAMVVDTDVIYCVNPATKKTHEIGAFRITFPFDSSKKIIWKNQTRLVHGNDKDFNAPHINAAGVACLGNIKDVFPKLLANRDFATALQLAIAFLESVDPADTWGKYIVRWPVVQVHSA